MPLTKLRTAISAHLSPERTRRATLFERRTVSRLDWDRLVRFNRWLELIGKVTTALWIGGLLSLVLGVDWEQVLAEAVNSGRPVKAALALVVAIATFVFIAARSLIGFARWRIQRELWRREVARPHQRGDDRPASEPA